MDLWHDREVAGNFGMKYGSEEYPLLVLSAAYSLCMNGSKGKVVNY